MTHSFPVPQNETERVAAFRAGRQAIASLRRSKDPVDQKAWRDMRDAVIACGNTSSAAAEVERALVARGMAERAVTPASVHGSTFLANMSVQYVNEAYIGDDLVPIVPVAKLTDEYPIYPKRDRLAVPDDSMKGRSHANEVSDTRSSGTYTCVGRGLKKALEKKVVDNQDDVFDEMMDLNDQVSDMMAFARESRSMTLLTTSGNYGGNTAAVAAADRWNSTGGGDPVLRIRTALHECWRGNGAGKMIGFCPLSVYLVLGTHPAILDLTKYTSAGIVPRQVLAQVFELDDLLVAKAWTDTANEGQTESISRLVTSKCFGIVRVAANPTKRNASFAYNFRFKGEVNNLTWYEEKEGTRGVYWNQQTTDEIAQAVAATAGYLLTTVCDLGHGGQDQGARGACLAGRLGAPSPATRSARRRGVCSRRQGRGDRPTAWRPGAPARAVRRLRGARQGAACRHRAGARRGPRPVQGAGRARPGVQPARATARPVRRHLPGQGARRHHPRRSHLRPRRPDRSVGPRRARPRREPRPSLTHGVLRPSRPDVHHRG